MGHIGRCDRCKENFGFTRVHLDEGWYCGLCAEWVKARQRLCEIVVSAQQATNLGLHR